MKTNFYFLLALSWFSITAFGQTVTTFAGSGSSGNTDGTGTEASFAGPYGGAFDVFGNMYVADAFNNTIRKITPAGMVTTFAGSGMMGNVDGTGTEASFNNPRGVAVDASGNVYVADTMNNKIRKITPEGVVSTFAGSGMMDNVDGTGTEASFSGTQQVVVDASGNVYVADMGNHSIRKISPDGTVITFAGGAGQGSVDGTGTAASFFNPAGVAIDAYGNVYVADSENHKIRKITPEGVVSTFAGSGAMGSADGTGTEASFFSPHGVAVDPYGNVYVADTNNNTIRKITPEGVVSTFAGSSVSPPSSSDGIGADARFFLPFGVFVDASGNVFVADTVNKKIRKITSSLPSTTTWNGVTSTDWNTASNWTPSGVPADGAAITIPNVPNYPVLDANYSIGDINLADGATLSLNGKTLTIAGTLTGIGTISGSNTSSLVLNGTGAMGTLYLDQTTLGTTNTLQNLTLNRTATGMVSLGNTLNLFGVYTPTEGLLTTGGFLTLKSNASGTATIAAGTGTYINGNVTVERYLPAKRAYRFITSPVTTTTSIYDNWQESGVITTGFGTQITGTDGTINGFDVTATNSPSIFTYNNTTEAWAAVTNTNVNTLESGTPYRLMVRGDRTLSLATNTPTPTPTTLRATGTVFTGSKTMVGSQLNQNLEGYSFIGNPYQAPVDIKAVLTSATGLYTSFIMFGILQELLEVLM